MPPELARAVREHALPPSPRADVAGSASAVAACGAGSVAAVVFFGSRKTAASPDPWSAYDFFVLTRARRDFYRALARGGRLRRSPALVAALNAVMPPDQLSLEVDDGGGTRRHAKCAVITLDAFERETGERRHDHFCAGRLFQASEIAWAADAAARERVLACLVRAHRLTYAWVRPWLPERFDAAAYTRTLLRVSMSWEIRPEPADRAEALWAAQRAYLTTVYAALLRELAAAGELRETAAGEYALARRAGAFERLRGSLYFRWSLVRATARWFKYIFTFEGWLDYILHKARRHTGLEIELSERERKHPVLFLWPRLWRFLKLKGRR